MHYEKDGLKSVLVGREKTRGQKKKRKTKRGQGKKK